MTCQSISRVSNVGKRQADLRKTGSLSTSQSSCEGILKPSTVAKVVKPASRPDQYGDRLCLSATSKDKQHVVVALVLIRARLNKAEIYCLVAVRPPIQHESSTTKLNTST